MQMKTVERASHHGPSSTRPRPPSNAQTSHTHTQVFKQNQMTKKTFTQNRRRRLFRLCSKTLPDQTRPVEVCEGQLT